MSRTGVPGLCAAGDAATTVPLSLVAAVASGQPAGDGAVAHLLVGV